MIKVATPAMAKEYVDFPKGAPTETMSDLESTRLMPATHLQEPAKSPA